MIIVCQTCKASYLVPASTFAAGPRQVRCARCGNAWMADLPPKTTAIPWEEPAGPQTIEKKEQPNEQTAPLPSAATADEKQARLPVVVKPDRGPLLRKIAAGFVALLLIAALVWSLTAGPLKNVFKAKATPPSPLSLLDVSSERRFENGAMQLVVDGRILNETQTPQDVPTIDASAIGPDGKTLHHWKIDPPAPTVEANTSVTFHSVITTPEGSIAAVNLKFAPHEADPQKNTKQP